MDDADQESADGAAQVADELRHAGQLRCLLVAAGAQGEEGQGGHHRHAGTDTGANHPQQVVGRGEQQAGRAHQHQQATRESQQHLVGGPLDSVGISAERAGTGLLVYQLVAVAANLGSASLIKRTSDQVLLGQLGQRNAEANLYQKVLDAAAIHYPAMSLQQMVGDTEAKALFTTEYGVAGVFTRQAWEGHVREAIDEIAEARREEIDWVLSDKPGDIEADLTPDVLRERLTERYFQDYSNAWLEFLNSLRWQQAESLADVIDQLTLMSDVRQSPLIALMNTLAYQGQAGTRNQALADSLVKSAQKLMAKDKVPQIEQPLPGSSSPLDKTFGPLLALLGKDPEGKGDNDGLSLQAFLNRVTRVRLKLQHVSNAPDPQEMTQALAQTVFQGKSIDLTDTQSYGSLIAASLGAEWGVVGQTLFVQPLEQAWQRVLQPSAAGQG